MGVVKVHREDGATKRTTNTDEASEEPKPKRARTTEHTSARPTVSNNFVKLKLRSKGKNDYAKHVGPVRCHVY
jgi:hypothetical protein